MGLFSTPKVTPPPPIPPAANPPILANPAVMQAGAMQKSKAAMQNGMGFAGTITNSGGAKGLEETHTAGRSLLG